MLKRLLDRPITVTMGLLVVIVLGIVGMKMLPVSLIPDVDVPFVTVQITAPELSSREIDESVMLPLRQQMVQMADLEEMRCESRDGSGVISLSFNQGTDMDYVFIEVNEKIDRSMGSLGKIERPKVLKSSASDIPAFYVNMTLKDPQPQPEGTDLDLYPVSDDFSELSLFASEVISKRIEQLSSVAMVDISGCVNPEILIIPDEGRLLQSGISIYDFENAIKASNLKLGSLTIRDGEYRYNVKFQSFASSKEDIENIYINQNGRIFQIKDLAQVIWHPAKRTGLVRANGEEAISMAIIKQSDARMSELKDQMQGLLNHFSTDYPEIQFEMTRDQTELLDYSINNLVQNIIVGVILACLVIFLFMQDFRSPALVAFTIPTALIFSLLVFYVMGISINIISLSGLVLGVGMMVDNTIVLTDNITARWQRGEPLREAVLNGTREVLAPMLSSVLTTCAVFIPLIFVSGTAGAMFYDQAMAVTAVLLCSYVITVLVIPVYYWWWYRKLPAFRPNPFLARLSTGKGTDFYEKVMVWCFRHRLAGWLLFGVSMVGLVLSFVYLPKTKLPEITYTDTVLVLDWNDQISLDQNSGRVKELEAVLAADVQQMTALVGQQQFVLSQNGSTPMSGVSMYMKFADAKTMEVCTERVSQVISERWPDAVFRFGPSGNIFDMVFSEKEAELVARIRPVSSRQLKPETLTPLVEEIQSRLPEVDFQEMEFKKDVLYVADPEKMSLYGVSYGELVATLRNSFNENSLFSIIQGNQSLPVVMGVDRRSLEEIISSGQIERSDYVIPLKELMRQTWDDDLRVIISGEEGNYYPLEMRLNGQNPETVMDVVQQCVRTQEDYEVGFSGSIFSNRKMVKELILVLVISLILLYLILASQFESLVQPLIILSEIAIDLFFALLALWIAGVSINIMSLIGLVVVCGIVINDSILKIDTINRLRKDGMEIRRAIMTAGQRRLKAIVMTSLTTILSVCPFLTRGNIGDDLQFPMSIVIIAGMTVGTLISLFFVPIVYYEVYRKKK